MAAYSGAVVGALILPVTAVYVDRIRLRAPSSWVTWSMLIAFFTSFAWLVWCKRTDNANYEVSYRGQTFMLGTVIPGIIVSAVVLGFGEVSGRRAIKNDG